MKPRYPVFIPSKGRADRSYTAWWMLAMGVPVRVVVEPCDEESYSKSIGREHLIVLPFENLGQGSIPARNFIWDQAAKEGAARHWIWDDNIYGIYRLNFNRRIPINTATPMAAIEDFVDRYENIAIAGLHKEGFAPDREPDIPPFYLNTRIYSSILLRTDLPYRWRGKYNEDTDLSLRTLKDGWCTVLFNTFLMRKATTMKMPGGNTSTVYAEDPHRLKFAESLAQQHPDVARVVWKFNRWHHEVDYRPFRSNELKLRDGITPTRLVNEYGMVLRRVEPGYINPRTRVMMSRLVEDIGVEAALDAITDTSVTQPARPEHQEPPAPEPPATTIEASTTVPTPQLKIDWAALAKDRRGANKNIAQLTLFGTRVES